MDKEELVNMTEADLKELQENMIDAMNERLGCSGETTYMWEVYGSRFKEMYNVEYNEETDGYYDENNKFSDCYEKYILSLGKNLSEELAWVEGYGEFELDEEEED